MSRSRLLELLVTVAFAAAAGHVAWKTAFPTEPAYRHLAGQYRVLASADRHDRNVYFRHSFHLSERPRSGWIRLIGHDQVELYANGELITTQQAETVSAMIVADLTPHLRAGNNVVALACRQQTLDNPPQVAVEGECRLGDSVHKIDADCPWRYSNICERGGDYWFTAEFDDSGWAWASRDAGRLVANPAAPPDSITQPPRGTWIGADRPLASDVVLRRRVATPEEVTSGWLRIQATGPWRLSVNGQLVAIKEDRLGTNVPPARTVQQIYDISAWLAGDRTNLAIRLRSPHTRPLARIDLELVGRSGKTYHRASDQSWQWRTPAADGWLTGADGQWSGAETGWRGCEPVAVLDQPWQQVRSVVRAEAPPAIRWRRAAGQFVWIAACALGTWALVLLLGTAVKGPWAAADRRQVRPAIVALLPATIVLGSLILLAHDPRIADASVYRVETLLAAAAIVLVQWLLLGCFSWSGRAAVPSAAVLSATAAHSTANPWRWALLVLVPIVAAGSYLRIDQITARPLSPDEVTMYRVAMSIWEHGFPTLDIHRDLPLVEASTSELVPYGHWLASIFFQDDRLVVRIASVLWGTATIVLLFWIGGRIYNPRVGVVAAAVYALAPYCASMANLGRYYSQLQFMALLVVYLYYRTIEPAGPLNRKFMWGTVVAFCFMFLTWEGSALLCPGLVLAGLFYRRDRIRTLLADPHVWLGIVVVAVVVSTQSAHRVMVQTARPLYGSGASDVSLTPMWKYPGFNPWLYVWTSSWNRDTFLPVVALVLAVWLAIGHPYRRQTRFLLLVFFTTALVQALGLPVTASRYAYHLTPLWILAGVAGVVALAHELTRWRPALAQRFGLYYYRAVSVLLVGTFVLLASGLATDLSELQRWRVSGKSRNAIKFPGQKGSSLFVRAHARPGDIVIVNAPHVVDHYLARPSDYWLESQLHLQCLLSDTDTVPLHRYKGTPMLTDVDHLRDVFARHARIWFITEPGFNNRTNVDDTVQFVRENMDVAYEDYASMVLFRDDHRSAEVRQKNEATLSHGLRYLQ